MLMSSRSAVSRHICSQPRRRRRSSRSRITPECQTKHWVTERSPSHYRAEAQLPACLQPLEHVTSLCPPTQSCCSSPLGFTTFLLYLSLSQSLSAKCHLSCLCHEAAPPILAAHTHPC